MTTADVATIGVDPAVVEMMNDVFADYRETHPHTTTVERDRPLWRRLDELGLVRLTGAGSGGGSGAGWSEAAELLSAAVRHGVRIPLAEHDLLACWLLEANGMTGDAAMRTVALLDDHGVSTAVPWANGADRIVVVWHTGDGYLLADAAVDAVTITPGTNLIGEPRDTVTADVDTLVGVRIADQLIDQLNRKAALVRALQVCAALDRVVALSIEHAGSRIQFGRPLSKFQTVQNLISDTAAEAALARSATEAALTAAMTGSWESPRLDFLIAVARSCSGHAASVVVRNAHQIHGAIGTTREHRLHEFTRPALAWRSEFGSVALWDAAVTDAALRAGGVGLWRLITG
jgi:acyl-CoA dehydrogenase